MSTNNLDQTPFKEFLKSLRCGNPNCKEREAGLDAELKTEVARSAMLSREHTKEVERRQLIEKENQELRECVKALNAEFNRMHDIAKGGYQFYDDKTEECLTTHAKTIERCL